MPMKMIGRTMKMNKIIFIYRNLHNILNFIKQHKIKHGPINKVLHYSHAYGHACEIYNVEDLALLNLGFGDSFKIVKVNENLITYSKNKKAIILDG